jgi:hypothetical protein
MFLFFLLNAYSSFTPNRYFESTATREAGGLNFRPFAEKAKAR